VISRKVDGRTAWSCLREHPGRCVAAVDNIGTAFGAGGDSDRLLKKFPPFRQPDMKDLGGKPGAVFGEGTVNWTEVLSDSEDDGRTKQYRHEEEGRAGPEG